MSSTPLEAGSQNSLPEIMEPQLYNGDDLSNKEDSKSLHSALVNGHFDVVQRLLDRGADVNERNAVLRTPLDEVSKDGNLEVARILIKYGADVNSRDNLWLDPIAHGGKIWACRRCAVVARQRR
jgi:ankyrin repeat protein